MYFIAKEGFLQDVVGGFAEVPKGNIRDEANAAQLVCLANLETLNAHFIHQGLAQTERLALLNQTAIVQMKLLLADVGVQRLQGKQP